MLITPLKNSQIWQELANIVAQLDAASIVSQHLELCNYQINGYWDQADRFYEQINLPRSLSAELTNTTWELNYGKPGIKLHFQLKNGPDEPQQLIGNLTLIYNENWEFIDENWYLDSPTTWMS